MSVIKFHIQQFKPIWRHKRSSKKSFLSIFAKRSLEDTIESLARKGIIANAALQAIEKQHHMGLSVTIKEGNAIYRLHPDGRKEIISDHLLVPVNIQQDILQIPD